MNEQLIPLEWLCTQHRVEVTFVRQLEEYGLLELTQVEAEHFVPAEQLPALEKWIRLHYELHVNLEGLDVIRHLTQRLEDSQAELRRMRAELRFYRRP